MIEEDEVADIFIEHALVGSLHNAMGDGEGIGTYDEVKTSESEAFPRPSLATHTHRSYFIFGTNSWHEKSQNLFNLNDICLEGVVSRL